MNRRSFFAGHAGLALSALFVLVAFSMTAFAQQDAANVRGTVKDQQGNVVAGAVVTLTNAGTQNSRTATTGDGGNYSFESIPVGDYTMGVEAQGFKKAVITEVHALISKTTPVDVVLEIGNVAESVTVSAGSAELLVNREDGTLGNNFVNKQITQLPLEARSIPNLLTLQAGTTRDGYVAGARADQSNITLDGVDINEAQTNQIINPNGDPANGSSSLNLQPDRSTVIRLNSEAIEEFRVTTTNANANQGRSAGAQVTLVTKSGSNDWHGAGFEFYRTKAFSANDFFNNKAGVPKPSLIRHTFGGALGGPIIKNRAFFFYSYEGDRITQSTTQLRDVPLASLGRGEVRYRNPSGGITTLTTAQLNAIFPAVGINPVAVSALAAAAAKYPANDFSIGDGLNTAGFRFSAPVPVKRNSHAGKFDFNLTDRQTAFVRVNVIHDLIAREQQFPDTAAPSIWSHPMGVAVGHTWTITNNFVNNFRYGYTREAFSSQGDSAENAISFRFVFSPLSFTRTLTRITPVSNFTDDITWIKEAHSFGFGTNIRRISNRRNTFAGAFDNAITNPSFYSGGGNTVSTPINAFSPIAGSSFRSAKRGYCLDRQVLAVWSNLHLRSRWQVVAVRDVQRARLPNRRI